MTDKFVRNLTIVVGVVAIAIIVWMGVTMGPNHPSSTFEPRQPKNAIIEFRERTTLDHDQIFLCAFLEERHRLVCMSPEMFAAPHSTETNEL